MVALVETGAELSETILALGTMTGPEQEKKREEEKEMQATCKG